MDRQRKDPVLTNTDVYDTDFYAWCLTTAQLVREGQWDAIDQEALAEELESLGKSQHRELESRLEELVLHLLKWRYQPDKRQTGHSWADSIINQRNELTRLIRDNPSLKPRVDVVLGDVYEDARRRALGQMGLFEVLERMERTQRIMQGEPAGVDPTALAAPGLAWVPTICPWTEEQILAKDFWPGP